MKKLHIRINGVSPLLMHSPKGVNPLHPLKIELDKYTSKRNKTEEDYKIISDLEWELGAYWDDNIGLYMSNECLAASILEGAKMNRNGSAIQKYCQIVDRINPLDIGEVQNYDKMKTSNDFRDVRPVRVKLTRVPRTRPRFNTWRCEFDMLFDENGINADAIALAIENAGKYCGICDNREKGYGRYAASIEEVPFSI